MGDKEKKLIHPAPQDDSTSEVEVYVSEWAPLTENLTEQLTVPAGNSKESSRSNSPVTDQSGSKEYRVSLQMSRLRLLEQLKQQLLDDSHCSVSEVESNLAMVNNIWQLFEEDHRLLGSRCKREFFTHPYMKENVQEQALLLYAQCCSRLFKLKAEAEDRLTEQRLNRPTHTAHRAALPEIKLPLFSGEFPAWPAFRDLFTSLVVDSEQLSKVEKLHYLKTSITGSAAQLISNLPLSNDSFDTAWQLIKERFDDKERLILAYVDKLFSCTTPVKKTAQELSSLVSSTKETLDALKRLDVPVQHWNYPLINLISKRLDSSTREEWEVRRSSLQRPTQFEQLTEFIQARARALEAVQPVQTSSPAVAPLTRPPLAKPRTVLPRVAPSYAHQASSSAIRPAQTISAQPPRPAQVVPAHSTRTVQIVSTQPPRPTQYPCDHCGGDHYIVSCPAFRTLTPAERNTIVTAQRLCYNCFGHHNLSMCNSSRTCRMCGDRHHTMIHSSAPSTAQRPTSSSSAASSSATARNTHPVRILIDPGSELTFVSNQLVNSCGLPRQHSSIPINVLGGLLALHTKGITTVQLKSNYSSESATIHAHILSKLTNTLPSFHVPPRTWPHLASLQLADPDFLTPREVDIVIGADSYGQIIKPNIVMDSPSLPFAQLTIFGWVVLGPLTETSSSECHSYHTSVESSNQELQHLLTKFWMQEEIQVSTQHQLTPEEQACEDHFKSTHTRDECGRYTVRIPLKSSPSTLGTSHLTAQRCLQRLIKRLSANDSYHTLYYSFMKEYEDLGHMKRVPTHYRTTQQAGQAIDNRDAGMTLAHDASASGGLRVSADRLPAQATAHSPVYSPYFLPHHGVLREDKLTTKLRVVFNGSSPTSSGVSLNDIQHVGAKIQRDISDVLLWIRKHKLIFATDITKMYRQINVHSNDWDLQRIMWLDEQLNMVPYHLTTVTYGTRSAPFLAIRTLLQLVEDEGHRFPLAIDPLTKGRYVDDIFGGSDHFRELIDMSTQVIQLCTAGGFPLAKWHSNNRRFIYHVTDQSPPIDEHSFEDSSTTLLGLSWIPHSDTFKFKSKPPCSSSKLTKRIILSETAQLYDPLGFLSPFIVRAKMLIQELWLEKLGWDDSVSSQIATKWNSIRQELTHVSEISIPRWIHTTRSSAVEFHGFSDASQLAMAAAIYIKVIDSGKGPTVTLICAKSKVAPLKRMTIPRLELTAALLMAKLMKYVQHTLELADAQTYLWTDSSVTLTWIKSHPSRWKDFVRNRVSTIQDLTPSSVWRFVPGKDNPADCASRGLSISQLQKHQLWWTGPQFLLKDSCSWPIQPTQQDSQVHQEERPGLSFHVATTQPTYHWEMICRYSSLVRLLRVTAICFRVSQLIKKMPHATLSHPLTPQDIDNSRVFWIKSTQAAYFQNELKLIRSFQLPPAHPFNRLTAFIDTRGIIRVGGRLAHANLELEATHPVILPRDSHFTRLIIADAHQKTLHGGTQLTMNHIRQSYWLIGGRAPVRSHILRCIKCARQRGVRARQLMGQLPAERVTPARPFLISGVDYAGPLTIKTWKGRGAKTQKGWLCIFVCFVTSALHLEAVSDYSADSFIAAFRRFTGRRGICKTLHSDCGTNFVGADAILTKLFTQGTQESDHLFNSLSNDGTTWRFNPPAAPHMGGKWEAAVKSVKYHLNRTVAETALTFEELTTLLIQIEAVLNSRPLEPLSDDPEDISALISAHFLIGESLTTIPEPLLTDTAPNRLSRWQLIQQRLQYFWSKWSTQYLQRHLSTSKWHHPSNEIKVGSLVLITDERLPPAKWPLARVTHLHPGKDGLTRVVSLKTATSTLVRPIRKLAVLPSPSTWRTDQL